MKGSIALHSGKSDKKTVLATKNLKHSFFANVIEEFFTYPPGKEHVLKTNPEYKPFVCVILKESRFIGTTEESKPRLYLEPSTAGGGLRMTL